ncbi:MAG: TatD family hydrolase [Chlorobiaceae bacterium]|nr:TatD family hydrolase [Chlorobiaceae bacterium]
MSNDVQPGGVDFHCHLDLYPDFDAVIARAEAARIYTLTVTTTPKAWPRNHELTHHTRYVRAALGLHPQLVAERAGELVLWEHYLPEARYIGEVGLDAGPRFYKSLDAQKQVFRTVLERCADVGGKILTVHSVRCVPTVLEMIESHFPQDRGFVVLHWFTGTKSEARRAAALGCYFSVNAEMIRSDRGQALVSELPLSRIITETDGPFTKIDNKLAEPASIQTTIDAIAHVRKAPNDLIAKAILCNFRALIDANI